jgi:predicted metal-dependent hydrolase
LNSDTNENISNSKTLPSRKFAQFSNNFDQLEKQQKQIEKLQKQQNTQQQQQQYYNSSPNQEFINPFPYYRNFQPTVIAKQNFNYVLHQHPTSTHHRHYVQNFQNKHLKTRNQFLMHKLESSLINSKKNTYNEPYAQNSTNVNIIHKKNSELKLNNNNKRRSTQVYNL